jgi:hypothetical protein
MNEATKKAKRYIKFLTDIIAEIDSYKGHIPPERKLVLEKKVIKYKNHIQKLIDARNK